MGIYHLAISSCMEVKILWDFEVRTDRIISARGPDIIVLDHEAVWIFN